MKRIITTAAIAAVAAAGIIGTTGAAVSAAVSAAPDCTPVAAVAAIPAIEQKVHTEWEWTALVAKPSLHWETKWTNSPKNPSTDIAHIWVKSFPGGNIFKPQITRTVIDVAAQAAVPGTDAVTCLAGEPQPKVLPIPGDNNDHIYENPSEQYVPHITGHVTQGWDNGVAKITYVTDEGYKFANGSSTEVVTVNEIRRNIHWVVPFSGDPNPATCTAAGSFDVNADGVASEWRDDTFYFDSGKVTLLVDRTVPGVVNLYVFSTDGDTLLDGLDPLKWNVNADGRSATRTITFDPQLAVSYGVPTVTGYGKDGVVDFGASACGTWKVGSKTTLTEGAEFQTHGGTSTTGPVTRYRLVFTPDTGLLLPAVLPGDGFQVGNSAVFHVYLPAAPVTTKQATFTAWEPAGSENQFNNVWRHDYTITVNADGTFIGTGVENGIEPGWNDGWGTTHDNTPETITGTIHTDGAISYTAHRAADNRTWTLTKAPTTPGMIDPHTGTSVNTTDTPTIVFRIATPQFVTAP